MDGGAGVSPSTPDPSLIAHNAAVIRSRIESAGGDPGHVTLVAVTKKFGADVALAAFEAGLEHLGENYATELAEKAAVLGDIPIRWHYLGAIQTNKLARLAPVTSCFQGLCRQKESEAIASRRPGASVMVQVDFTGQPGRGGAQPSEVSDLVGGGRVLGLDVCGLMTVAPQDPIAARASFRRLREMADDLGVVERSMGMTDDLEIAVEEGSTMVRVGRALFGGRPIGT